MKNKIIILVLISLCLLTTPVALIKGTTTTNSIQEDVHSNELDTEKQDGRFIEKLQWYSPNGELPGTYEHYLKSHPRIPARFSTVDYGTTNVFLNNASLAILVDETLYPTISTSLAQYLVDLDLEGYTVVVQQVSGGTPEEIKAWVQGRYADGYQGILFIGDITAAWAEVSGDQFPSDLFYMDLDGTWEDTNADGVYEVHQAGTGDMGPELYVGRIYATTLNYDSEANMVNEYFTKA
ncbi:MAG: hypothetical protein JXA75_05205, partial [Candidatus Thermoplasmatota archaeon]|nr:hypothetical protein [Candidatus Thermoplasmatota archaeon]